MQKLKINFVDFWPNFNKSDNYFFHLLSMEYDVEISVSDPDLLFFSVDFSKNRERDKYINHRCKKIFYTGENVRPNLNFPGSIDTERYSIGKSDFSFSFDYTQDKRNYRLPLWILFINWFSIPENNNRDPCCLINLNDLLDRKIQKKEKFCNFIFSNNQGRRVEILNSIQNYKNVECAGRLMNNTNYTIPGRGDQKEKVEYIQKFKYTIASENSKHDGYTTEKILHPLSVGSIPIYWGSSKINEDFNNKCFINVDDYDTLGEMVDYLKYIDNSKKEYEKIILEPVFPNNKIPEYAKPENVLNFFKKNIL